MLCIGPCLSIEGGGIYRFCSRRSPITLSTEKGSIPQLVWWITNHSRVPRSLWEITSERIYIVACAAASVPDHMGIAFRKTRIFCGVEPCIHACKDRKCSGWGEGQIALTKLLGIFRYWPRELHDRLGFAARLASSQCRRAPQGPVLCPFPSAGIVPG